MLKKPLYHRIIQSCEQVWNLVFRLETSSHAQHSKTLGFIMYPGKPDVTINTISLKFGTSSLVSEDIIDSLSEKHIGFIFPKHFHSKAISYHFF